MSININIQPVVSSLLQQRERSSTIVFNSISPLFYNKGKIKYDSILQHKSSLLQQGKDQVR